MFIRYKIQIQILLRKFIKPQYGLPLLLATVIQWLLRGAFDEWFFDQFLQFIGGEPMTSYLIYLPILLILGILVKMYIDSRKELQSEIVQIIPNLLRKMHRRMMEFTEFRAKEKLDAEKFQTANELLADITGVIGLEEQDKVMTEIKEKLGVRKLPKTTKGKKKLSKKLLRLSKEIQLNGLDKKWGVSDLIKIGESLDSQQIGIGDLRDRDRGKWKRWYNQMNSEKDKYNNKELNKLVNDNIFISYGCCSEWLQRVYLLKMSDEITELTLSNLRGATANMLINIDKAIEETILPIINRIQELKSQEKTNGS